MSARADEGKPAAPRLRRRFLLAGLAVAGLAALALFTRAPHRLEADGAGAPQLVAVTFSSAWCAACRILSPRLADAMRAFENEPVRFIDFDFSFGPSETLAAEAEQLGIADVYEQFKGATGFTVLVDPASGKALSVLTAASSREDLRARIAAALAATRTNDPDTD